MNWHLSPYIPPPLLLSIASPLFSCDFPLLFPFMFSEKHTFPSSWYMTLSRLSFLTRILPIPANSFSTFSPQNDFRWISFPSFGIGFFLPGNKKPDLFPLVLQCWYLSLFLLRVSSTSTWWWIRCWFPLLHRGIPIREEQVSNHFLWLNRLESLGCPWVFSPHPSFPIRVMSTQLFLPLCLIPFLLPPLFFPPVFSSSSSMISHPPPKNFHSSENDNGFFSFLPFFQRCDYSSP